jgi:hypothetical protein
MMPITDTKRKQIQEVLERFRGSKVRLAVRLGVTPSTVAMALSGARPQGTPRVDAVLAAADEYASQLLSGEEVIGPHSARTVITKSRKQRGK